MLFGPTNAPSFYTVMMKYLKDDWDKLFIIRVLKLSTHDRRPIILTAADEIKIGSKPVNWGTKVIIDDIYCGAILKNTL